MVVIRRKCLFTYLWEKVLFYVRKNVVVLSAFETVHRQFQWTTGLCFAWILRRNFVCFSFFPSFSVWPLQPNFKCRGLLLHLITLNDTHTHTTLKRTPLSEGKERSRDLYLTTHNINKEHTSTPLAEFETAVPANEKPLTHAVRPCSQRDRLCLNFLWLIRFEETRQAAAWFEHYVISEQILVVRGRTTAFRLFVRGDAWEVSCSAVG